MHKGLLLPHITTQTLQGCAVKNGVLSNMMNVCSKQHEQSMRNECEMGTELQVSLSPSTLSILFSSFLCYLLTVHFIRAINLNTNNPTVQHLFSSISRHHEVLTVYLHKLPLPTESVDGCCVSTSHLSCYHNYHFNKLVIGTKNPDYPACYFLPFMNE